MAQNKAHEIYAVEKLLSKRTQKGKTEYWVKWQNWGEEHNTWEPEQNILDYRLIDEFNTTHRGGPQPKKRGPYKKRNRMKILVPPESSQGDTERVGEGDGNSNGEDSTPLSERLRRSTRNRTRKSLQDSISRSEAASPDPQSLPLISRRKRGRPSKKPLEPPLSDTAKPEHDEINSGESAAKIAKLDPTRRESEPMVHSQTHSELHSELQSAKVSSSLPESKSAKFNPTLPESESGKLSPTLPESEPALPESGQVKLGPTLPATEPALPESGQAKLGQSVSESEPQVQMVTKTVWLNPNYDYWRRRHQMADRISVTDVQVDESTVTIRECPTDKGFFEVPECKKED